MPALIGMSFGATWLSTGTRQNAGFFFAFPQIARHGIRNPTTAYWIRCGAIHARAEEFGGELLLR